MQCAKSRIKVLFKKIFCYSIHCEGHGRDPFPVEQSPTQESKLNCHSGPFTLLQSETQLFLKGLPDPLKMKQRLAPGNKIFSSQEGNNRYTNG